MGGFLKPDEYPEVGARREAAEETGLDILITGTLGIYIDKYGVNVDYKLNIYYIAEAPFGEPVSGSDVSELRWFAALVLATNMAFDHQHDLLRRWVNQL